MSTFSKSILVGVVAGILSALAFVLLFCSFTGPSTRDLDADIFGVDREIAGAQNDVSKYGGLIQVQAELRLEALQNTRAMLDQKRKSLLRGISLSYTVDGNSWKQPTILQLVALKADWDEAEDRAKTAKLNAAQMGGLMGAMAQVTAETEELAASMAGARYRLAKAGTPILGVTADKKNK